MEFVYQTSEWDSKGLFVIIPIKKQVLTVKSFSKNINPPKLGTPSCSLCLHLSKMAPSVPHSSSVPLLTRFEAIIIFFIKLNSFIFHRTFL